LLQQTVDKIDQYFYQEILPWERELYVFK
jgi:hypothetical protein